MMQPRRFGSRLPGKQPDKIPQSTFTNPQKDYSKTLSYKLKLAMLVSMPVLIIVLIIIIATKPEPIKVKTITCPYCQHKIERSPEEVKDAVFIRCDACNREFVIDAKKARLEANSLRDKGRRTYLQGCDETDTAKKKELFKEADNYLAEAVRIYRIILDVNPDSMVQDDLERAAHIRRAIRSSRIR